MLTLIVSSVCYQQEVACRVMANACKSRAASCNKLSEQEACAAILSVAPVAHEATALPMIWEQT